MKILNLLCAVVSMLLAVGCSSTYRSSNYGSNPPVYGGEVISSGPYGATMVMPGTPQSQLEADRALENSLRGQLNRYGDLANASPNVQIYAQSGTVTLTGTVPSPRERDMIESLVRNNTGVAAVNDQLQVNYPPTGPIGGTPRVYTTPPDYVVNTTPALVYSGNLSLSIQGTTLTDRNLGHRVGDRLRADPVVTPLTSTISISVSDGRVYLRGTVDSEQQHLSIVSIVQHTYGVTAVYDQLVVR